MPADSNPGPASGLARAFLHQALAAAKNRVRAQKAAQEADSASALAFNALAEAQDIHANKALMFLRGRIEDTAKNRALALHETRELLVDALDWVDQAQAEGDKAAAGLLTQLAKTLKSHLELADTQDVGPLYVCAICGHIHAAEAEGEAPGRCPVCQAVPEKFRRVPA